MTLALTSDSLPLAKVEDLADTVLAQKISQLSGVGLVSINGGQKPAVRIQANPTAMANYGLSLEDLRSALGTANVDQAKGNLNGTHQAYTIGANDQLLSSADYNKVIIAYRNGSPVRLSDVANAVDSAENLYQAAWMGTAARPAGKDANGNEVPARDLQLKPAVIVNIQRQPGANIIGVVDEVQKLLPQLRATLPATRDARGPDRPHQHDPRLGEGRAVLADADDRAGRHGDLPVPAIDSRRPSFPRSRCRCRSSARSA